MANNNTHYDLTPSLYMNGQYIKGVITYNSNYTSTPDESSFSVRDKVDKMVTKQQDKLIKEQVQIWMDDRLKKRISKEVENLLKDIEYLKEEKARLGKSISSLKHNLKKTKADIEQVIADGEKMFERYAERLIRFENLDL